MDNPPLPPFQSCIPEPECPQHRAHTQWTLHSDKARKTHDPGECLNQIPSVWMPISTSSSKIFLLDMSPHMSTKTGINEKRKKYINTYTSTSTLIIKKEKNCPVKNENPTKLKKEALMPESLHLCQLMMPDGWHQESQERSETTGNKVDFLKTGQDKEIC